MAKKDLRGLLDYPEPEKRVRAKDDYELAIFRMSGALRSLDRAFERLEDDLDLVFYGKRLPRGGKDRT